MPIPKEDAREQFFAWLKQWRPHVYATIADKRPDLLAPAPVQAVSGLNWDTGEIEYQLSGLGLAETGWLDAFSNAAKSLVGTYVEKKSLDIQLKRLQLNQPPLPQPEVQQAAQQAAAQQQGGGMGGMLPMLAIGGAALFMFMRKGRR